MNINPLTQIDFYKADHRRQYPEGTTLVYSNFTPRSTRLAAKIPGHKDGIVFFGLQYYLKWFLVEIFNQGFFKKNKEEALAAYDRRMFTSLGKGAIPVEHIAALHDLGYLPLSIRALPEGSVVDEKIPVFTVENTHPDFFWLTNYLESNMSAMCWKMCNSATIAWKYRQLLTKYARLTGTPEAFVGFQAHDFSFRGMGGLQDAAMSGAAHLTSFVGTDTVPAIDFLEEYYWANSEKELVGCSVPATEHSVMCMGGQEGEIETFRRLITEVYPRGIVSIVSDTWDFWSVVRPGDGILAKLKNEVMARSGGAPVDKVVIRPDSGDPYRIICGYQKSEVVGLSDGRYAYGNPMDPTFLTEEEVKGAIQCLWDTFGGTITEKGYRLLDSHIGLIYGDSITLERCHKIMAGLAAKGFASGNVVLGVGSFTYTYATRDTLGFAMKATAGIVDGEVREIFKDPKTDKGLKKSARGFLRVDKEGGRFILTDRVSREEAQGGELVEVFRDGKLLVDHKLSDIRARIAETI